EDLLILRSAFKKYDRENKGYLTQVQFALFLSRLSNHVEELKGLEYEEAVVKIIKDELSKTNTTLEDTIKGGERLKSTWQNLLGELSESQFFKDLNDGLIRLTKFLEEIRQIRQITGKSFTIKDGAVGIAQYFSSISDDVRKLVEDISTLEEKIKDTNDEVELEKLKKDLKSVRSYLQDIVLGEEEFNNVVKYTNGLEDLLNKKIEKLKSGTGEVVDGFMTIEKITNRINSLKLILNTADSEEEIISLNKELKDLEYELNRLKKIGTIDIGVQAQVIIPPTFTDIFDTDAFDFENVDVGFNPINIFDSDMFAQDVEDVGKELDNFLNDLNQFEITASEIAYNISGLFGDFLTDAFSGQEDALQNFIAGLGGLMKSYGELLVAFGVGEQALFSGNPAAAIVAGAALIAIGAALSSVKGSISNYSTGSNYSSSNGSYGNTTCPTGDYLDENREIILKIKGNDLVGAFNKNSNRLNNNS
ncbi:MAG: hypothetical protein KDH96_08500, partial [Candidatus Riesia sp.]|nr:hypothetical protein [Candidatus Riesia sp.]